MGYSVGKWQGDTLAVDTIGFNETSWLDLLGHPRSELMRIRELYRRRDFGHMDLEVTLEDTKYYTRPFTFKTGLNLIPDSDVLEFVCGENEKDQTHTERSGNAHTFASPKRPFSAVARLLDRVTFQPIQLPLLQRLLIFQLRVFPSNVQRIHLVRISGNLPVLKAVFISLILRT
jgi:hypothetical protein